MNTFEKRDKQVLLVLLAIMIAYGIAMAKMPLFEPDEGRYAEIPREMLATGNFITPKLAGVDYLEKPPLYYWLNALAQKVLGPTQLAARLWSMIAGFGGALLVMALGRHMFDPRVGRRAALILLTSPLYFALVGINIIDMTLSCLMALTLGFFWLAHESDRAGTRRKRLWWAAFAFAALTVLTKGLVGMVLPGGIAFSYLLLSRQLKSLGRVPWVSATLLFLAIAVPWHVLIALETPGFLNFYFVHEHFLRYLTDAHARTEPFWFFLPVLGLGMLPWVGYLWRGISQLDVPLPSEGTTREQRALLFLTVWIVVIVGFFSLSSSKLVPYVLPATLPLALLFARGTTEPRSNLSPAQLVGHGVFALVALFLFLASIGLIKLDVEAQVTPAVAGLALLAIFFAGWDLLANQESGQPPAIANPLIAALCLCFAILFAGNQVAEYRTSKRIASCLRSFSDSESVVFAYDVIPQSLPFYLGRTVGIVGYLGEIEFGVSRLPEEDRRRDFPTTEEFRGSWQEDHQMYLVLEHKTFEKAIRNGLTGRVVCDVGRYRVLSNLSADHSSTH
jgi:4-amino-4-deoxy-L-arabinose transferase-like glycosyltransferase